MPHIEYSFFGVGELSIQHFPREKETGKRLAHAIDPEVEFELHVNNDNWSWSTPYEGVKASFRACAKATESRLEHNAAIKFHLSWDRVAAIAGFLNFLLANAEHLRLSPEDAQAALEEQKSPSEE